MNLDILQFETEYAVPRSTALCRLQRRRARSGTHKVGRIWVSSPGGFLRGRFDVAELPVAYFAEQPETAIYEVLARREAEFVSYASADARQLLFVQTTRLLKLFDLRPHAESLPFLQATRYAATQELAAAIAIAGYEGVAYRSAQQYGADCYALFGDGPLRSLKVTSVERLVSPAGELHKALATAIRGARIKLTK